MPTVSSKLILSTRGPQMETTSRKVDWLAIDQVNKEARRAQADRALSLEERTKRALARGEKLLAEARLAHKLAGRS